MKMLLEDSLHRLVWLMIIMAVLFVLSIVHLVEDHVWLDALTMGLLVVGNILVWQTIWPIFEQTNTKEHEPDDEERGPSEGPEP
jgi:chromate transport protein ChrA